VGEYHVPGSPIVESFVEPFEAFALFRFDILLRAVIVGCDLQLW
jgi:hypothetical protein